MKEACKDYVDIKKELPFGIKNVSINSSKDKCLICGVLKKVLDIDNSSGEYNSLKICEDCANKFFRSK